MLVFEFSSNTAHVREMESNRRVRSREKTEFFFSNFEFSFHACPELFPSHRSTFFFFLFFKSTYYSLPSSLTTTKRMFLEVTHPFVMRIRAKRLSRFLNLGLALPLLVAIIDYPSLHLVDITFTS